MRSTVLYRGVSGNLVLLNVQTLNINRCIILDFVYIHTFHFVLLNYTVEDFAAAWSTFVIYIQLLSQHPTK